MRGSDVHDLKFQSLADDLRREILAGTWPAGAKLPTEQQLATETGLSLTTVRRAFDELVEHRLVVRRQGAGSFVTVDAKKREVRTRRTIGVLLPDTQLYYPRVLQGIEETLSDAGASLQLTTSRYDCAAEDRSIQFLLDDGVDGLLLVPMLTGIDDPVGRAHSLMNLPVPVVLLERSLIDAGAGDRTEHVCSDHQGGAYDAVDHLRRLGHDRIALMTRMNTPTEPAVVLGYRRAVQDLGLTPGLEFAATKQQWSSTGAQRALEMLQESGATAALVFGDREATVLEAAARRAGLSIPGDLALVSYDDETADLAEVPLTAVSPPKHRVGRMSAEVLLRRLVEGDACPLHQVQLRPRLVIRDSCGARQALETPALHTAAHETTESRRE